MLLIALTGGLASGKTTVSSQFIRLGCSVIDADLIAREGKVVLLCLRNRPRLILTSHHTTHRTTRSYPRSDFVDLTL